MKADKAVLEVDGESLVARAAARLGEVCDEVVVADRGRGTLPDVPSIADGAGAGPAAGILGAAAERPGRELLVLACDLPCVPPAMLAVLQTFPGDWVVPSWRRGIEPLAALYRGLALAALARGVTAGRLALHSLTDVPGLRIGRLEGRRLAEFGDPRSLFLNVNTPEELRRLRLVEGAEER